MAQNIENEVNMWLRYKHFIFMHQNLNTVNSFTISSQLSTCEMRNFAKSLLGNAYHNLKKK